MALILGSMAWKVNSVALRPGCPASNLIVGTHSPKSAPAMLLVLEAPLALAEPEEAGGAAAAAPVPEAEDAAATAVPIDAAAPHSPAATEELFEAVAVPVDAAPADAPVPEAEAAPAAPALAPGAPTFPSASLVVKLEKPFAAMTSATLMPSALNGVVRDWAEAAFSTSDPPTAGSTRGTMPRMRALVGRVGSLQMVGMLVVN